MEPSSSISGEIDQLAIECSSRSGTARSMASAVDFEIPKALRRPRDVSYPVQSLYDDIKRGLIDVNPEYQRDVVWKQEKQMMLIDTVWTNHYVPPVIFSIIYDDNGAEVKKICLDGKQRLTSLQLFMDGIIPCKHPETLKTWWFKVDESSTTRTIKHVIPKRFQSIFASRQIRCTEYEELEEEDEREIFRRVQLGVALSSAEKLRVLNTHRARFINELKDLFITEHGLAAPSFRWDRSRGADYRCIAQAVYALFKWGTERETALKNAGTLPQVEKWLEEDINGVPEDFSRLVKESFSLLVELVVHGEFSKPFAMYPKVSPVEIVGVVVLIYAHSVVAPAAEKLNLYQLSAALLEMRQAVRREHKDIRLNDRVGKTIVNFVKTYRKPAVTLSVQAPQASRTLSIAALTHPQAMIINPPSSQLQTKDPSLPKNSSKRKCEPLNNEELASKRLTTETPRSRYVALVVPSSVSESPSSILTTPATTSTLPSPRQTPQEPFLTQFGDSQYIVGRSSGYRYPGASVHQYPSHYYSYPAQYHSPPSATTTPPSRSEAPSSSSTVSSASTYGDEHTPSPATTLDALKQPQELKNMSGQESYQTMAKSSNR